MADTNLIYPYELEGGKKAVADEVMANFEAIQLVVAGLNSEINNLTTVLTEIQKKPTREMMDIYYSFSSQAPTGAFPLWTGETLTNAKTLYPQFWKKLNQLADDGAVPVVASEAEYEEKIEKYGQCASFYINTLDGHIRLPKITRFISSIEQLTDIGEYEDSNKAHTHGVRVSDDGSKKGTDTQKGYLARGFTKYSSPWSTDNDNGVNEVLITPEGGEAQPKHVRLYLYLQVVNNTAEISELDVSVIADQLNNALTELDKAYRSYTQLLEDKYNEIVSNYDDWTPETREIFEDVRVSTDDWSSSSSYVDYPYEAFLILEQNTDSSNPLVNSVPSVIFNPIQADSGVFATICNLELRITHAVIPGSGDTGTSLGVVIYAKEKPTEEFTISTIKLD